MEVTAEIEIDNPTNIGSSELFENVWPFGMVILLGGVASVVVRYRRSQGEERQQLRWFVSAVAVAIGLMAVLIVVYFAIGALEPEPLWSIVAVNAVLTMGHRALVPVVPARES